METYYNGDFERQAYSANDPRADAIFSEIEAKFPWFNRNEYMAVATKTYHPILKENVITCYLPLAQTEALFGVDAYISARKFCMDSGTSFIRSYELDTSRPTWLPSNSKMLAKGTNHAELNRPYNELASTFVDYYFSGDPDEVEAAFGLPYKRGAYETWYGATVEDGIERIKQYCYDTQSTFSDWDVAYMLQCKRLGRKDLL